MKFYITFLSMCKDTHIISDLRDFFRKSDANRAVSRIFDAIQGIKLRESQIRPSKRPNCKYTVMQVFHLLLLFPFFQVKNAYSFEKSPFAGIVSCGKDVFYEMLNDQHIHWRRLVYSVTLQLIERVQRRKDARKSKDPVCLIADDTDLHKTGMRMENIGYVYDHVSHRSRLGYKGLFLCRTDGKTQQMLDFSLHGEEGKNSAKIQGLTDKQRKARYQTELEADSPQKEREAEYMQSKLKVLMDMVRRAISHKVHFDYLLVDSWFTCTELLQFIHRRKGKKHLLGMAKNGTTKYNCEFGVVKAATIINKLLNLKKDDPRRVRYSKKYHCHYAMTDAKLGGIPIRLFFVKSGEGRWRILLTTNRKLDFFEAYRIYSMRWAIEVAFHECKSLLNMGKCQSRSFTAQIASISITMLQYNLLSMVKRFESYESIGGLFKEAVTGLVQLSVTERIWEIIISVISELAEMIAADAEYLISAIAKHDDKIKRIMHLYNPGLVA